MCQNTNELPPNIPSPNAATLSTYGDIPVSLYTGTPSINIPVYVLRGQDVAIPVSLSYHAASVKVNSVPGWLGLGWNLNAGGAIVRQVKSLPDETIVNTLIPYGLPITPVERGFYYRCGDYNGQDLLDPLKVDEMTLLTYQNTSAADQNNICPTFPNCADIKYGMDYSPDEFDFNFLGYTGKFFRTFGDCQWKVVSDDDIKVELEGFIPTDDLQLVGVLPPKTKYENMQVFRGFTLVTPDGIRYTFGVDENAIEFSRSVRNTNASPLIATAWNLTKIETPTGEVVNYVYSTDIHLPVEVVENFQNNVLQSVDVITTNCYIQLPGVPPSPSNCITITNNYTANEWINFTEQEIYDITHPTPQVEINRAYQAQLSQRYAEQLLESSITVNGETVVGYDASFLSDNMSTRPSAFRTVGNIVYPSYLKSVSTSFEVIEFERIATKQLNYKEEDFNVHPSTDPSNYDLDAYPIPLTSGVNVFHPILLQFTQIDKIKVETTNTGDFIKEWKLEYINQDDERLKLISINEVDSDGDLNAGYSISYNANKLPPYLDDAIDHWGYYNGASLSNSSAWTLTSGETDIYDLTDKSAYSQFRDADQTGVYSKYELIERLTYPTGGYTTFEFEPHDYSSFVSADRQNLVRTLNNDVGGGVRIKEITSVPSVGESVVKRYHYVDASTSNIAHLTNLKSSGILMGMPDYNWEGLTRQYFNATFELNAFSSSPYNIISTIGGITVGYSNVLELTTGNGFTKYDYLNYSDDTEVIDDLPLNTYFGNQVLFGTKERMLGKPKREIIYTQEDQLVNENIFNYERRLTNTDLFQTTINKIVLGFQNRPYEVGDDVPWQVNVSKYHDYVLLPDNTVRREYTTNYDGDYIEESEVITYDSHKLLSTRLRTLSNGHQELTSIKYTHDYNVTSEMISKNILNLPVKTEVTVNGDLIKGQVNEYYSSGLYIGKIQHSYQYENAIQSPPTTHDPNVIVPSNYILQDTYNYDAISKRLTEYTSIDGITTTSIWGYSDQFPVATIVGASYDEVVLALGTIIFDEDNNQAFSIAKHNEIKNALPDALVRTYTYDPESGITRETDPNGRSIYYEYDGYGRLIHVIDNEGNSLQRYKYKLIGPQN